MLFADTFYIFNHFYTLISNIQKSEARVIHISIYLIAQSKLKSSKS